MTASNKNSQVAVLMGSDSDLPVIQSCIDQLKYFEIDPVVRVMSAHRTPDIAAEFAKSAQQNGIKVIIAAAGMAAHLAGAMAAHSQLPIIGIPLAASSSPAGLDAMLSTVQMPPGLPVATMGIGKAGAKNAAILAAQIIATADEKMKTKVKKFRDEQTKKVIEKDQNLQNKLA
jgi:phosphoribosylaminoimidazole carboxylase PurE protein